MIFLCLKKRPPRSFYVIILYMAIEVIIKYLTYLIIAINLLSFFIVFLDKKKAENETERISEKTLFALAILFGGIGIYFAMFSFHHKTKKWYFVLGIPFIIAANIYLLNIALNFLNRQV